MQRILFFSHSSIYSFFLSFLAKVCIKLTSIQKRWHYSNGLCTVMGQPIKGNDIFENYNLAFFYQFSQSPWLHSPDLLNFRHIFIPSGFAKPRPWFFLRFLNFSKILLLLQNRTWTTKFCNFCHVVLVYLALIFGLIFVFSAFNFTKKTLSGISSLFWRFSFDGIDHTYVDS